MTTRLYTLFFGRPVGRDEFGNAYYKNRNKRWVVYSGGAEPSTVPPHWHGWLHHATDVVPSETASGRAAWVKPHQPNRTGSAAAYVPAGHLLNHSQHAPTVAQYEPWIPN